MDSQVGEGSTFWFEVPLPVPDSGAVTPGPARPARGLRVLVVDDNATNRLVLESQLWAWGMRPDVVGDRGPWSADARSAASGEPYAIAVLDMCMPDMDGLELAGQISADPGCRHG